MELYYHHVELIVIGEGKLMKNKTSEILSIIIIFLTAVASVGGLLIDDLYKDTSDFVLTA